MFPWRSHVLEPTPSWATPVAEAKLLAVDIETTGLDVRSNEIVSIGWVPVRSGRIIAGEASYSVVQSAGGVSVGHSATIHHLTDQQRRREGIAAEAMLAMLLDALDGHMMLAHFAQLEQNFLESLYRQVFRQKARIEAVDTFEIERRHMERMATYPKGDDLRLPVVRERYGLPRYQSHNALSDALACAELYLAQSKNPRFKTLKDFRY